MKRIMITVFTILMSLTSSISQASDSLQYESIRQLDAAIAEIQTTKSLMPKPLRKNLESALTRLGYVKAALINDGSLGGQFFCSVESSFHNRVYTGRGSYELEAKSEAIRKCKADAKIFCDEETLQCESSRN